MNKFASGIQLTLNESPSRERQKRNGSFWSACHQRVEGCLQFVCYFKKTAGKVFMAFYLQLDPLWQLLNNKWEFMYFYYYFFKKHEFFHVLAICIPICQDQKLLLKISCLFPIQESVSWRLSWSLICAVGKKQLPQSESFSSFCKHLGAARQSWQVLKGEIHIPCHP